MNITEYKVTITGTCGGDGREKELIWRGNENVIIREKHLDQPASEDAEYDGYTYINIPLHILKKFVELFE